MIVSYACALSLRIQIVSLNIDAISLCVGHSTEWHEHYHVFKSRIIEPHACTSRVELNDLIDTTVNLQTIPKYFEYICMYMHNYVFICTYII